MARCGCGGACSCALTAGDNITVGGSGTAANPWVINAVTNCAQVRNCLDDGCGITYNNATGVISANLSEDASNALECRPNGLYVGAGAATVTVGCGLSGNGAPATPLTLDTKAWPFPCDQDSATAMGVYCDPDTGQLHGDPPYRVITDADSQTITTPGSGTLVPATDTNVATHSLTITNPDPCRIARLVIARSLDVYFDLPPGASAAHLLSGDEMVYHENNGDTSLFDVHTQTEKSLSRSIGPGASTTITIDIGISRGSGGARARSYQSVILAWLFSTS